MSRYVTPFENTRRRSFWDLGDPWGVDFPAPLRLFEQKFGVGLDDEDLFPPTPFRGWYTRPRRRSTLPQETGLSEVCNDNKEFKVNLDVTHFKPEEISVKVVGNQVTIEGKHEEREDDHGLIQRYFKRTYILPKDVDCASVKSSLSADGVLAVAANKKAIAAPEEREIPIEMNGGGDAEQ